MDGSNYTFTGDVNTSVLAAVFTIEFITGLTFNVIVIIATIFKQSWKKPGTIFFTSLLLANLLLVVLSMPFLIIGLAAQEWIFGSTNEEKKWTCLFAAFNLTCGTFVILLTVSAISFDRFLFIIKPRLHKRFMRPSVTLAIAIGTWVLSAVLASLPFFGFGLYVYESRYGLCQGRWIGVEYAVSFIIVILFNIAVISITSIWVFCFTRIFIKVHPEVEKPHHDKSVIYVSKKKRLFGIFGSMLLSYIICFSPLIIISFISFAIDLPDSLVFFNMISYFFITIANPLVQSYFRPDIKEVLFLCYKKIAKKH